MKLVLPGIFEKDLSELEKKIRAVESFTTELHIDLTDGKFTQNTSITDPQFFKQFSDYLYLEVHMMVDNPVQYLKPWADAGFKRFIGHVEKMPDVAEFIAEAQLLGEVGLAIDAGTSVDKITVRYEDLDCILVMTVNAGLSGQQFLPDCLEKVKKLREQTLTPIEVDGGMNAETLVQAARTGANRFVTTSTLFNSDNPRKTFETLTKLAEESIQLPPEPTF